MSLKNINIFLSRIPGTLLFGLFLVILSTSVIVAEENQKLWSELLAAHVDNGVVNYSALKSNESVLDKYLESLDTTDPSSLSEKDRLALYMNAYNAYTIKLILKNFEDGAPIASIKKIGGFFSGPWKVSFCRIGGKVYTLDDIEHEIIRPLFKEPRIHFAINCAAKSCPPLISTAYSGQIVDAQLERNTINFINNPKFNYLDGSTLYVSKIFKWFSEDFEMGVEKFIKKYAEGDLKEKLEAIDGNPVIKYLDYDWSLNGH